ncbi:MAG: TolC family protein [Chitinophagales bacterium]|nr:TolC family protein [Chitinophagales bacterium]
MYQKQFTWILFGVLIACSIEAQSILKLEEAQARAAANYPLLRQKALAQQQAQLNVSNLQKNLLPQVSLGAQATYQSEVTQLPIKLPNITVDPLSKDQYRALLDVNQLIYDGGVIRQQQSLQHLGEKIASQQVAIELQKLRERINQIYLGALLLEYQLGQTAIVEKDLQAGLSRIKAQVSNGTAVKAAQASIEAELIRNQQRAIEISFSKQGLLDVLAVWMGDTTSVQYQLLKPEEQIAAADISRPELTYFMLQDSVYQLQNKLVDQKAAPKLSAFAQGGYGRPGLNMLKNEFAFFYTTGLRLQWSISSLYTNKQEKELTRISSRMNEVQKDQFMLQTNAALRQQLAEINKYKQLLSTDQQLIGLRVKVKETAAAQLENGLITPADYVREVQAEDQARQNALIHEMQLLQAIIQYNTISGK